MTKEVKHTPMQDIYGELSKWHTDDSAVMVFADAMRRKLRECRERGRSGWDDPTQCYIGDLKNMFFEQTHHERSEIDLVDVANYCMMLHQRGVTHV